ncbi:MAG: efflux RND transporter periplasmic adaptor subunit [Chlamydiae bacterium]|nr:efflux RND transporter periplasmic adaptor subunit [Chlamydiota bacterium]MBI3277015.1 efflux RND transporter periplasmic adaptor subunit [Chlamydiota bacterium]
MKIQKIILSPWVVIVVATLCLALPKRLFAHGGQIETGEGGGGPVKLTIEQQTVIGLETVTAQLRDIDAVLVLNGKVKLNPNLHAHVSTRIEGRVEKLYANVGDKVEKGERLADIQSRQIGNPPPIVTLEAIVSGVINDRSVTLGESVEPNKELFHIIDLSEVIVEVEVYEEDIGKVKPDQAARVRVLGYPGDIFKGKITFVGVELDPEKRTLPVWVTVKNPDGKLKPEMFAKVAVVLEHNEGVLAVPKEAILEESGEKFVFVQAGDSFNRVDVQTGAEDDRFVEIRDGLVPDDVVVTDGKREVYTQSLMARGVRPPTDTD